MEKLVTKYFSTLINTTNSS